MISDITFKQFTDSMIGVDDRIINELYAIIVRSRTQTSQIYELMARVEELENNKKRFF